MRYGVWGAIGILLVYGLLYTYLVETGHPREAGTLLEFPPRLVRSVGSAICAANPWCLGGLADEESTPAAPLSPGATVPGKAGSPVSGQRKKKGHKKSIGRR